MSKVVDELQVSGLTCKDESFFQIINFHIASDSNVKINIINKKLIKLIIILTILNIEFIILVLNRMDGLMVGSTSLSNKEEQWKITTLLKSCGIRTSS